MVANVNTIIRQIELTLKEEEQINELLDEICYPDQSVDAAHFLSEAHTFAQELPRRIRREIYEFTLYESSLGLCVKNNPIRGAMEIGPTPDHIPSPDEKLRATREEILHMLYASLLGEVFAWSSIQNGNIVNEVIPLKENEEKPMSSGSANLFGFHTEDAFHECAGDYFGLMCLRNPTRTPTLISWFDASDLDENTKIILGEPRFIVGANIAHNVSKSIKRLPILFGDFERPYFRINLNSDAGLDADDEAQLALDELTNILNRNAIQLSLEQGDCLYLDNFRAVHGRSSYKPNYDGNDRWLKRLYISSYLRKSRNLRTCPEGRVILID
jgi:L-asparagine oxygenase